MRPFLNTLKLQLRKLLQNLHFEKTQNPLSETVLQQLRPGKPQILCLLAGLLFFLLASFTQTQPASLTEDGNVFSLPRPEYGETVKQYTLTVLSGDGTEQEITVPVSPRELTQEEAEETFRKVMDILPEKMLGDNKDIFSVSRDLIFFSGISGFPGVAVTLMPQDLSVLSSEGKILPKESGEAVETSVSVLLQTGGFSQSLEIPLRVFPPPDTLPSAGTDPLTEEEDLETLFRASDRENADRHRMILPASLNGQPLRYAEKKPAPPVLILILSVFAALLLKLRPLEEKKSREEARKNELLLDYSELLSEFILYLNAGMTIRNVFFRMAERYSGDIPEKRPLHEEIIRTADDLRNGIPSSAAYEAFARRCGCPCYLRFASLLEQNQSTGDTALIPTLLLEMEEAFEIRKNTAKRLGEEAGTKLVFPLMLSLISVLSLIAVPAVLKML